MTEPVLDQLSLAPDRRELAVQQLRDMGAMHGFPQAQIDAIVAAFLATEEPGLPQVCGNVSKDGLGLVCARAPHRDEPFARTPHAAKHVGPLGVVEARQWMSQPTLPEQLAEESDRIHTGDAQACALACEHLGHDGEPLGWVCVRVVHGADKEHAGRDANGDLVSWV